MSIDYNAMSDDAFRAEVRRFEALSRHMTRALQMSIRLEHTESGAADTGVLDALPHALAVVDAQRRLLHANAAMESLLRRRCGLAAREGRIEMARACFDFLPTRAALDLSGWTEEDVFAH